LLEVIKSLHQDGKQTKANATSSTLKRKMWPPESQTTDTDESVELSDHSDSEPSAEEQEAPVIELSASPVASTPDSSTPPPSRTESQAQSGSVAEEAMRDLLGHLVQSITERAERKAEELLTGMFSRQVEARISQAVKDEIEKQFAGGLLAERIAQVVRDGIADELPKAMTRQKSDLE